ncbi:23S rRNA (pseudouridine(1915)-N(3))-methyltransferase RlmH [bacterium]|nr:23S rRNA (pseudouridine(1915)-N(3))-methyltransferase RlmH [bacterium]
MRFRILGVGEYKLNFLAEGESDFMKRLKRYCRIEVRWLRSEKIGAHRSKDEMLHMEGKQLLSKIPEQSIVVALDRQGEGLSSEAFSDKINRWMNRSVKEVVFVIGGPLGLDKTVLKKADFILSFSMMTFTHEMIRLLLLEQLYRAFTILRGEKYHK